MSLEFFDGEVSLVKYVTELTMVDVGRNSMLLEGNKVVQFNAYQPWFLPRALGRNHGWYALNCTTLLPSRSMEFLPTSTMVSSVTYLTRDTSPSKSSRDIMVGVTVVIIFLVV